MSLLFFFDFIEICRGISWSVKGIRQTEGIPFIIHFSWICYASGIERFVKTCINSYTIHKIQTVGSQRITGYVMSFVAYEIDKAKITGLIIGKRSIIATLIALDVIMNITFLRKKKKVLFLCFEKLSRNTYLMPKNT